MGLIFAKESYQIVGAAMIVYNTLGCGFAEAVYQEALEIEFRQKHIPNIREAELTIEYKGIKLNKHYIADFICFDHIIVELKAVSEINDAHRQQVYNYLKATHIKLGLLINFGQSSKLEYERILS